MAKVVKQLRSGVENLAGGHGAEIIRGEGVLTGPHTIKVGEELVGADQIILAAGSVPGSIPVPGADLPGVMNSDGVLSLEECPESVVIIGGGGHGGWTEAGLQSAGAGIRRGADGPWLCPGG